MRGLINLGATCYFNAAVQALAHVPRLAYKLIAEELQTECELTLALSDVVTDLFDGQDDIPVNPRELFDAFVKKFPDFATKQHDSQEVLLLLIDALENSLGKEFIQGIFNGSIETKVTYPGGISVSESTFVVLCLDVTEPTDLATVLADNFKAETIYDYKDSTGKKHDVATIEKRIVQWPQVIIFCFPQYDYKFHIELPLHMGEHNLFSLIVHRGSTLGGHYVNIVRVRNKWYLKDDELVRMYDEDLLEVRTDAYCALYRIPYFNKPEIKADEVIESAGVASCD